MTIWFDVLGFGPFYAIGLYAYIRGKEWIRLHSVIYSSVLFTRVKPAQYAAIDVTS